MAVIIRSKAQIERLIHGAMGEIKADLIVRGGKLVNVYSGEILEGMEIAVLDGRICYVGPSAAHTRGSSTQDLNAQGLFVSPGFIDAHTHISHYCRPYEYLQAYLPHGTTSLITTPDELSTVFGFRGLKLFLDEVAAHPARVYTLMSMVSPQDPLLCNTRSFSQSEVAEGLDDPRVFGLGEIVSWLRLTQGDQEVLERIEMTLSRGKIIHGHTSGAKGKSLCAVAAAGVSSCHESIREQDVLDRMRSGFWLMLREGSFRRDLEATLKPVVDRGLSTQRLILVTDGMSPDDVAEDGHIDFVVRRAIHLGLSPIQAIQAVTLNPATYSGLEQEIGGIAPGRFADFALLEDLEEVRIHSTVLGGEVVAQQGKSLVHGCPISLPEDMIKCLKLRPTVSQDSFQISCSTFQVKIRVMELLNPNITKETILQVYSKNGYLEADLDQDLLKVAVFDRHGEGGKIALGFLKGFGARVGAVGTTADLDENTLMVAGSNDRDMALCANVLIEEGGGMAVVDHGEVLEKIDFPVGGVFSLDSWQQVGRGLSRLNRCLREKGSIFTKPIYALCFLTFVTLPSLRITSRGLVKAKDRKLVPLLVED